MLVYTAIIVYKNNTIIYILSQFLGIFNRNVDFCKKAPKLWLKRQSFGVSV